MADQQDENSGDVPINPDEVDESTFDSLLKEDSFTTALASTIFNFEYMINYIMSYGASIADFNIGFALSLQRDITDLNTDCYRNARTASLGIEEIFNLKNYHGFNFNTVDLTRLFGQFQILFVEEQNSCQMEQITYRAQRRF